MTSPNKTNRLLHYWPIVLTIILMALPLVTFAADTKLGDVVNQTFELFSIILTGMQAVLWPILLLMGGLLDNDLLFSGGMQTILLNIWTAVRDFINVLFVLGLLVVAIFNILGAGGDDYTIKKILPKIAISLIAINFSFLACKVVLDAVNVTTTAIYAVPLASNSLSKYQAKGPDQTDLGDRFCNKIFQVQGIEDAKAMKEKKGVYAYCESADSATTTTTTTTTTTPTPKPSTKYKLSEVGIKFFKQFNSQNVALVMAMELMSITNLDTVDSANVKDPKSLSVQVIFSLIFLVIYATSFIALFVAMLIRIVVLWITIATVPISFIGMAFTKVKDKLGKENDPWNLFLSHALVPIPVALVLTIGMIMISQLKQITPGIQYSTDPNTLSTYTSSASTLQDLIAGFATAAFIWTAAFQAMKGTKADKFLPSIQNGVERFGKNLAKLPLYMPLIPTKAGKVGLAALGAGGGLGGGLERYMQDQQSNYAKQFGSDKDRALAALNEVHSQEEAKTKIAEALRTINYKPDKEVQAKIADLIVTHNLKDSLKVPQSAGVGVDRNKFIEELKAGKYTDKEKVFQELTKENSFVAPSPDISSAKDAAKDATTAAKASGVTYSNGGKPQKSSGVKALDDAAVELAAAEEELAKADDGKKDAAAAKVKTAAAKVKKYAEAKSTIGAGFEATSVIDSSGKLNSEGASKLKDNFSKLPPDVQNEIKTMLVNKFNATLHNEEWAKKVVDNVISSGSSADVAKP